MRQDLKPIRIRQSAYLNNRIEQDHRAIKHRILPMLGFKSTTTARVILGGIEMVHMVRKQQANYAHNLQLSQLSYASTFNHHMSSFNHYPVNMWELDEFTLASVDARVCPPDALLVYA